MQLGRDGLAGDADHRDRVGERGVEAGDHVGAGRAGGADADADVAGDPGPAVGRVRAALFVADGDVPDRAVLQRRVERQDRRAGDAEDGVDALGLQRPRPRPPCRRILVSAGPSSEHVLDHLEQRGVVERAVRPGRAGRATSWATRPAERQRRRRPRARLRWRCPCPCGAGRCGSPGAKSRLEHSCALAVEDRAAGQAAGEHVEAGRRVDARASRSTSASATSSIVAADDELVGGLDGLPGARRADVHDRGAERLEQRPGRRRSRLGVAADHDRQRPRRSRPRSPPLTGASSTRMPVLGRRPREPCVRSPAVIVLMSTGRARRAGRVSGRRRRRATCLDLRRVGQHGDHHVRVARPPRPRRPAPLPPAAASCVDPLRRSGRSR